MKLTARLRSFFRAVLRRSRLESDMDDELHLHLDHRTEDLLRSGLSPEEARRRARMELGPLASHKEDLRDSLGLRLFDELRADVRHAFRQMNKSRGVTAVAIASIALGIGATAAVYSIVHAVLIDTHPYRDADRIIHYTDMAAARTFEQWRKLDAIEDMVATDRYSMNITNGPLPENVDVARVSSNLFDFFGVPPVIGRTFTEAEKPERAAVVTYGFWQRYYGGDVGAIGKTLQLDREVYTVVGIVPPRFRWKSAEVFIPADLAFYKGPSLELAGRLKPGATIEQANAQGLADLKQRIPTLPADYKVVFQNLKDRDTRSVRDTLLLFLVAVFILLAVACGNVSILLLARGTARQHEMALRAAIGASRRRLARQLLTESLLLTGAGGLLGVLLAYGSLTAILAWLPAATLPPESSVRINLPVLLFSTAAAMVTGLLAGFAPAIRFSHPRLAELIQAAARRATGTRTARRAQLTLVAVQVALTVLLLAGAGAAIRGLVAHYQTNLGYDPTHIVRVTIPTPEGSHPTWEGRKAFFQGILHQVRSLPQAQFAALSPFSPPFGGMSVTMDIPGTSPDPKRRVPAHQVSEQYFGVLHIPLLQGRIWSDVDTDHAAQVAVINQEMARRYWPNDNPVGKTFSLPSLRPSQWIVTPAWSTQPLEIIGIVGNVTSRNLREPPGPAIYIPYTLHVGDNMALIVRSTSPLDVVIPALRREVHAAAPGQAIASIGTGESILRETGWQREEIVSTLFTIFAGLALALAAIGLYSAISYATALRSQEFGIRMALGAQQGNVIGLVVRPAATTVSVGIVAGLAASVATNKILASWTKSAVFDGWVLASVVAVLVATASVAAIVPALRAARTDPASTLRE